MNEKRFVATQVEVVDEDEIELCDIVFDTEDTYAFMVRDTDTASDLCDLLNEQQEENERLKKEVENLQSNMMESLGEHRKYEKSLEEENNKLKVLLKNADRQAEIGRSYVQQYCSPQQEINYNKRIDNVQNQLTEELGNDYLTLACKYL